MPIAVSFQYGSTQVYDEQSQIVLQNKEVIILQNIMKVKEKRCFNAGIVHMTQVFPDRKQLFIDSVLSHG
jgi:hypothetical protein